MSASISNSQTESARAKFLSQFKTDDEKSAYFKELGKRSGEARRAAARELVERSTAAQGLPERLADLSTLEVVAVILMAPGGARDAAA